jgi:hypothetical protein
VYYYVFWICWPGIHFIIFKHLYKVPESTSLTNTYISPINDPRLPSQPGHLRGANESGSSNHVATVNLQTHFSPQPSDAVIVLSLFVCLSRSMTDGALRAWGQRAEATKSLAQVAFLPSFLSAPTVETLAYREPPLLSQSPAPPPLILPHSPPPESAASTSLLAVPGRSSAVPYFPGPAGQHLLPSAIPTSLLGPSHQIDRQE